MIEKLDMKTSDFTDENIEKIATLFPNCVTEAIDTNGILKKAIDFDLLKQELSENIVDGPRERYQINWPGKKEALLSANTPINKTLRPCREESVDFDTTENLYIEGDNLEVLKLLQESYLGKIKMIYIDPPYNTGKDFVYKDNFTQDKDEFLEIDGQRDEDGGQLVANLDSNGRYHSDWLSMIYPRLKLARNLLKDDGSIFISIDDNEIANMKKICDEIYGEDNFIAEIAWQKRTAPDMRTTFSDAHEYILVYGKTSLASSTFNRLPLTDEQKKRYKNPDNDPRGPWVSSDFTARGTRPNQLYGITTPSGKVYYPAEGKCWQNIEEGYIKQEADGRFYYGVNGDSVPRRKNYLNENMGRIPWAWWANNEVGHSQEGKVEVNKIFEKSEIFSTPKPIRLIHRILNIATFKDSIVLDFFSGSSATAHACLQINSEDNGTRRCISVQIPEITDEKSEAYKAGYKNICEIGKERIRRAGKKIKEENADKEGIDDLDIGFRVLKVDSSNMKDVYYSPDATTQDLFDIDNNTNTIINIKDDREPEDLLFQVLLDWGVDLTLPIVREEINGKTVYLVDEDTLVACFDDDLDKEFAKEIAMKKPLRAVFKESGYKQDEDKINIDQVIKQFSPDTEIRAI